MTGNIKIIRFGDPNMKIKRNSDKTVNLFLWHDMVQLLKKSKVRSGYQSSLLGVEVLETWYEN